MITYLCEDTPEGIFTAVYDAWAAKIPDDRLHLMTEQEMNFSLFTECRRNRPVPRSTGGDGSGKSSQGGTFHPAEDRK